MTLRNTILMVAMLAAISAATSAQQPTLRKDNSGQKVIRDPVEYKAYMTAKNTQDPLQRGAAFEAFAHAYPESVVYVDALEQAMAAYQQAGTQEKVLEVSRHILETRPHNMRAQAIVVTIARGIAANGGPEAQNALREVCSHAQKGLEELPRWQKPESMTESDFEKLRSQMTDIFAGGAGYCALQRKDFTGARAFYETALRIDANNFQNAYQLSLADLEMDPIDPNGFWYCSKAINLAERQDNAHAVSSMAAYCKAKYERYHGGEDGWDGIVSRAATETAPPSTPLAARKLTPAELAVRAIQENDPASLSFSDWEFVLQYRDASPANKQAADRVWEAVQAKGQNGRAKLKIPIKVISATADMIHAAVTGDNQEANREDLQVSMQKPMSHLPAAGSTTAVIGVIQDYTPNPFKFLMVRGELEQAEPAVHTQLNEADIEKLLRAGVTPKRATELVKQKGVDFALDNAAEDRLRQAGATPELLLAIARGKSSN